MWIKKKSSRKWRKIKFSFGQLWFFFFFKKKSVSKEIKNTILWRKVKSQNRYFNFFFLSIFGFLPEKERKYWINMAAAVFNIFFSSLFDRFLIAYRFFSVTFHKFFFFKKNEKKKFKKNLSKLKKNKESCSINKFIYDYYCLYWSLIGLKPKNNEKCKKKKDRDEMDKKETNNNIKIHWNTMYWFIKFILGCI